MDIPGPQQLLEDLELQHCLSWSISRFQRCSMGGLWDADVDFGGSQPGQGSREGTMGHEKPLSWGQLQPCHLFLLSQEIRGFTALIDFFPSQAWLLFSTGTTQPR